MQYAALTASQRAQVAYLFADAHFGTDVNAYAYLVDARGNVTGRRPNQLQPRDGSRTRRDQPVKVATAPEPTAAHGIHPQTLAAILAREIRKQNQEVTA